MVYDHLYDFFSIQGIAYSFITAGNKRNQRLLMLNGYTFSKNNSKGLLYYCSKISNKCKASVKLNYNGKVVRLREDHNHAPPKYMLTASGDYIKLSS